MGIEWDEKVETKRRVRMVVSEYGPTFRDATIDDLRLACEAAGLVVETAERATADLEDRTNLREAYQKLADERDACLDALAEHVSPDGTVTTPRMIRPSSVLAGIRALQGRLRDYREHDVKLSYVVDSGPATVFMNGGIRAVAERVRRDRCLIARAVAANIDVRVAEDHGGGFLVAAHRAGEDEDVERNVPAAEVRDELARMLDEVEAARKAVSK